MDIVMYIRVKWLVLEPIDLYCQKQFFNVFLCFEQHEGK